MGDMEMTTNREATMTRTEMIQKAEQLERSADNLYMSLLAPSMAERAMREDAEELRRRADEN
jgi:hypothetical protein